MGIPGSCVLYSSGFLRKSSSERSFLRACLKMSFLFLHLNGSLPGYWILGYRSFFLGSLELYSDVSLLLLQRGSLRPLWFPRLCETCSISGSFQGLYLSLVFLGGSFWWGHLGPSALQNFSVLYLYDVCFLHSCLFGCLLFIFWTFWNFLLVSFLLLFSIHWSFVLIFLGDILNFVF